MDYTQRLTYALDKETQNICVLAYMPLAKLESKLELISKQTELASKNNLQGALLLLKEWKHQIEDAMLLKQQLNIKENDKLELDLYLPELDDYDMIEKRQEILQQKLQKETAIEKYSL